MRAKKLRFLQDRNASAIGHSGEFLLGHLTGTEAILMEWGLDASTCDAGLFHSVYGTETFRTSLASPDERREIADLIGARAERLAFLFCAMVKSSLDDNLQGRNDCWLVSRITGHVMPITRNEFIALAHISLANWIEQRDRHGDEYRDYRVGAFRSRAKFLTPKAAAAVREQYGP